ncbi:MAG: nickel-dependent lactate racemase [Chloroflexota bacterium]|nr:nickel-dependent lactate racemase [Chloroflexota bacterium]
MEFLLPYGKTHLNLQIPTIFKTDLLTPSSFPALAEPHQAIQTALINPLGRRKLAAFANVSSVGIAINDKTRPVPQPNPINVLLDYLSSIGIANDKISIFIGSGTHTPMQEPEISQILDSEIISQYRIFVHDCDRSPMVDLGKTAHRTPIHINADFNNCDIKITVGNIEPHHFMGFSGGVKTAVIGLSSRETITANHSMLTHPQAKSGVFHINPMRQDIEEMGRKVKIDYSLGLILNEQKQIVSVFFGEPVQVMDAAIPIVRDIFGVCVNKPYNLVIASPGGAPKDINLYQAQKGLTHATRITRNGGWVILTAACPEGSGSLSYESYITAVKSHQAVLDQFEGGYFQVGPHKAFQIARDAVRVNIVLVSDIAAEKVKQWLLTPSKPQLIQHLINWIAARLPSNARVAVLPASTRTMTEVKRHE